jgi:hypothetical protein
LPTKIFVIPKLLSDPHIQHQISTELPSKAKTSPSTQSPCDNASESEKHVESSPTGTIVPVKTAKLPLLQPTANRIPTRTEVAIEGTWIHLKKSLHQLRIRRFIYDDIPEQSQQEIRHQGKLPVS